MPSAASASFISISSEASDLTFTTSVAPCALTMPVRIALASAPSRAQCTWPPAAWTDASSCSRSSGRRAIALALIAAPASRSASQSATSPTTAARLARIVRVAWPRLRRCWVLASASRAAAGKPLPLTPPPSRRGSRRGAPSRVPARARESPPPMCSRQELSSAVQISARVSSTARSLSVEHRRRRVGVLHRERPAEAAARLRVRQLDEVDALHLAQEAQRAVADLEQAQPVARRVVGHAVREVRADVLHAEDVDEQLAELVHARPDRRDLAGQPVVLRQLGQARVAVADHRGARSRRGDDRVVLAEHADEPARQRHGLQLVAGVRVHLPAAGLLLREDDLVPEPLEQPHHGLPRLREERVVEACDEERYAQSAQSRPSGFHPIG